MTGHIDQAVPSRQRLKIVVIDDDPLVRGLIKLHLVNEGYDVLVADDAIAGGYLAIGASPDLIICDVEMPHMDGYQLVAALKADPATRQIPIVFLTSAEDVADRAQKLGAVAYLNKPVLANRLLEVVAKALGKPASGNGS